MGSEENNAVTIMMAVESLTTPDSENYLASYFQSNCKASKMGVKHAPDLARDAT